jgi:hypothetical protein
MNRTIKFRAWVTDLSGDKFMLFNVTPYYILEEGWQTADKIYGYRAGEKNSSKVKTDTSEFVLEQHTGTTDPKGNEIYEGDIVTGDSRGTLDEVIFSHGCFCLANAMMHYEGTYWGDEVVVKGNIHENPELIK